MADVGNTSYHHLEQLFTDLQETDVKMWGLIQKLKERYRAQKEFFDFVIENTDVAQNFPFWETVDSVHKLTVELLDIFTKLISDMHSKMCELCMYEVKKGTLHYELITEMKGIHHVMYLELLRYERNADVCALNQFFSKLKSQTMQ